MVLETLQKLAANRRGRVLQQTVVSQRQARENANAVAMMVKNPVQYLIQEVVRSVKTTELWDRFDKLQKTLASRRNASVASVANAETRQVLWNASTAGLRDLVKQYRDQLYSLVRGIIESKHNEMVRQMVAAQRASQTANQARLRETQRAAKMFRATLR